MILEQFKDARALYNAYKNAKTAYSGGAEQEAALEETLAPFLRSLLGIAMEFWAASECGAERGLMRQFAGELEKAFTAGAQD